MGPVPISPIDARHLDLLPGPFHIEIGGSVVKLLVTRFGLPRGVPVDVVKANVTRILTAIHSNHHRLRVGVFGQRFILDSHLEERGNNYSHAFSLGLVGAGNFVNLRYQRPVAVEGHLPNSGDRGATPTEPSASAQEIEDLRHAAQKAEQCGRYSQAGGDRCPIVKKRLRVPDEKLP